VKQVSFAGNYAVNADCTGTFMVVFPDGAKVHYKMAIVDRGHRILWMPIDEDPGTIYSGEDTTQ
jgi:hypothetical protein